MPINLDPDEAAFAQGRLASRTYATRSFELKRSNSDDDGSVARFVYKVIDTGAESDVEISADEWVVSETPAGRYQIKLLVAREAGNVKEIWIHRVPGPGKTGPLELRLILKQPDVSRLIELLRLLDHIPVEGDTSVRVDDQLLRDLFSDPDSVQVVYDEQPDRFRHLIENDEAARDVIALAGRRKTVERFRMLMTDADFFDMESERMSGPESVWQALFEEHPWLLGATLATQVLTSWNEDRLEQVVAGFSVAGSGKRTDALLRTSGRFRSMVFAEIKTHRSTLLSKQYRPGCWAPSPDLAGAVAQVQGTVYRAMEEIGERIVSVADDGSEVLGDETFLFRPKSILVVGDLAEFVGSGGGPYVDKVRSFELYRRNQFEPEIVTFDELLARAEWMVGALASESTEP